MRIELVPSTSGVRAAETKVSQLESRLGQSDCQLKCWTPKSIYLLVTVRGVLACWTR